MEDVSQEKLQKAVQIGLRSGLLSVVVFAIVLIVFFEIPNIQSSNPIDWSKISWWNFIFGWLLMCSALLALGYRWKVLIAKETSGRFLGASLCSALLLNYAVPGPFGEVAASWFVHKKYGVSMPDAIASATVARLVGLGTAALGVVVLWCFFPISIEDNLSEIVLGATLGVGIGMSLIIFLMFLPKRGHDWLEERKESRIWKLLLSFAQAFVVCRSLKRLSQAFFWSVIGHTLAYLGFMAVVASFFDGVSPVGLGFSYMMGTCVGAVAFLFPGSQFTWDVCIATLLFSTTELTLIEAGTASIVLRIAQLLMMMMGAVALFFVQGRLQSED